ncbi:hypothetical protein H7691_12475 [Stenotrophomonas sp. CW117]|uniref:hypothetical protein n=1 Tax=Stenotrophomonas TaxID=40323 RepID=UPI0007031834|nr:MULTISPECIES: hypothetical protein [Stenotrophomonas]KRG86165.1 hypothetical protein ABB33_05105 [Stenotrophomonas acidaminiphila]QOF97453.1 hypothetical protein H7691_12475 [Stenotrophomonas sp. CW117]
MRIDQNEPDTTAIEDDGTAAAAAQAAATVASNDGNTNTEALDAFSQGVEKAREQEVLEDGGAPAAAADGAAADPAAAADAGAAAAAGGAGAPGAAGGEGGDPDPAAAAAAAAEAANQPDAIDAEIKDLGISNERTQKRFRELSERAAEVETLRPDAERGRQWEETIKSTGADPQQMGNALNYLAAINSRDPAAMAQAYEFMQQEMAWLAKELGRPAPGYDPLAEYPELAKQVADGDMTKAAAEELIRTRRASALQQDSQQRQRQVMEQSQAATQTQEQAMQDVQALGAKLRAADPQHFDAKFKAIQPMVAVIQDSLPPQQWAAAIQKAYLAAPAPVAAPAQRQPAAAPNNPVRATGVDLSKAPTKENAFDFGVQLAKTQGR